MFVRKDITDVNPNENLHQMANELAHYMVNDLIFTSAGELVNVVVKPMGNCECGDCGDCNDWISGDIVQW
jgi:hypothetical protein